MSKGGLRLLFPPTWTPKRSAVRGWYEPLARIFDNPKRSAYPSKCQSAHQKLKGSTKLCRIMGRLWGARLCLIRKLSRPVVFLSISQAAPLVDKMGPIKTPASQNSHLCPKTSKSNSIWRPPTKRTIRKVPTPDSRRQNTLHLRFPICRPTLRTWREPRVRDLE